MLNCGDHDNHVTRGVSKLPTSSIFMEVVYISSKTFFSRPTRQNLIESGLQHFATVGMLSRRSHVDHMTGSVCSWLTSSIFWGIM